jgi:glycosyltransferase involved in cell wall biosynthesis
MIDLKKVLIIIPCYKASGQINGVVDELLSNKFKNILVVDDCCPDNSSSNIRSKKLK